MSANFVCRWNFELNDGRAICIRRNNGGGVAKYIDKKIEARTKVQSAIGMSREEVREFAKPLSTYLSARVVIACPCVPNTSRIFNTYHAKLGTKSGTLLSKCNTT